MMKYQKSSSNFIPKQSTNNLIHENEASLLNEKNDLLINENKQLLDEIEEFTRKVDIIENELLDKDEQIDKLNKTISNLKSLPRDLPLNESFNKEREQLKAEIDKFKKEIDKFKKENLELKNNIQSYKDHIQIIYLVILFLVII